MPMTTKTHKPTIHGPELRALVLNAIPSMRDEIGEDQDNPHQVMHALFKHATRVISEGDIPAVIRCFTLTKELASLGEHGDIFVTSAIWASYIHRFRSDDPVGLKVFRAIDPQVRTTLYSPFRFP